ncbi:hypothetical protein T439DRAFT_62098 [Meredithblackwellia eburnea MCA 4105]
MTSTLGKNQVVVEVPTGRSQNEIKAIFSIAANDQARLHTAILAVRVPPDVIDVTTTSAEEQLPPVVQEQHTHPDNNQTSCVLSIWRPGGSISSTRPPSLSTRTEIQGPPMPFYTLPIPTRDVAGATTNDIYRMASRRIIPTATKKHTRIQAVCPIVLTTRHQPSRVGIEIVFQSHHILALDIDRPRVAFACGFALFTS